MKSKLLHICAIAVASGISVEATNLTEFEKLEQRIGELSSQISQAQLDEKVIESIKAETDNLSDLIDALKNSDTLETQLQEVQQNAGVVRVILESLRNKELVSQKDLVARIKAAETAQQATEKSISVLMDVGYDDTNEHHYNSYKTESAAINRLATDDITRLQSISSIRSSDISVLQNEVAALDKKLTELKTFATTGDLEALQEKAKALISDIEDIRMQLGKKADKATVAAISTKLSTRASNAEANKLESKVDSMLNSKADQKKLEEFESEIRGKLDKLEEELSKAIIIAQELAAKAASANEADIVKAKNELANVNVALAMHGKDVERLDKETQAADTEKISKGQLEDFNKQMQVQFLGMSAAADLEVLGNNIALLRSDHESNKSEVENLIRQMNTFDSELARLEAEDAPVEAFEKLLTDYRGIQKTLQGLQEKVAKNTDSVEIVLSHYGEATEKIKNLWDGIKRLSDAFAEHMQDEKILSDADYDKRIGNDTDESVPDKPIKGIEAIQADITAAKAALTSESSGEGEEEEEEEEQQTDELGEITAALSGASDGYAFYGKTADAIYNTLNGKVADVSNFVGYANKLDAVGSGGEGTYLGDLSTTDNIENLKTALESVSEGTVTSLTDAASATYASVNEALGALKAIVMGIAYVPADSSAGTPAKYTYDRADADADKIVTAMKQAMSQLVLNIDKEDELSQITTALSGASNACAFYDKTAEAIYNTLNGKVADVSNFVGYANTLDAVDGTEGKTASDYLGTNLAAGNIGALNTALTGVTAGSVTGLTDAASATYASVDAALGALKAIVEGIDYEAEKYTYGGAEVEADKIVTAMKRAMSQVAELIQQ